MEQLTRKTPIKMGILGCAAITPVSVLQPLRMVDSIEAYGIASRSSQRAREYAQQYQIPVVYERYEDLLGAPEIACVYLPLANNCHLEWGIKAARTGKAILVEKPACLTLAEFEELVRVCQQYQVPLLEAVMVQHHPWQKAIAEMVASEKYGRLIKVKTRMSFLPNDNFTGNYRAFPESGGGVFYDLGSYWIQFAQAIVDLKEAVYHGYSSFNGPNGCDWSFAAELVIPTRGLTLEFSGSFELPYQARHELEFEAAVFTVPDFFRVNTGNHKLVIQVQTTEGNLLEKLSFPAQNYYVNQLHFWASVLEGRVPNLPWEETAQRIDLMERIYADARQNYNGGTGGGRKNG